MKKLWIGLGSILAITAVGSLIYFSLPVSAPANTSYAYEYYYTEEGSSTPEDPLSPNGVSGTGSATRPGSGDEAFPPVDTDPASITVLVNHLYTLPEDYVPEDLRAPEVEFSFNYMADKRLMREEAASALEELFAAASEDGIRLTAISGYRSYERQKTIYLYNVNRSGEDYANQYSAPPGHSEHQTGLTMDVSSVSNHLDLTYTLAELPEGQWLAENSHRFGFIIRYPEDKEAITGYAYEPWHLRYVGIDLATYLYENNLTLDEYYGVSAEDYEWSFDLDAARKKNNGNTNTTPGYTSPSYPWKNSPSTKSEEEEPDTQEPDEKDPDQKEEPDDTADQPGSQEEDSKTEPPGSGDGQNSGQHDSGQNSGNMQQGSGQNSGNGQQGSDQNSGNGQQGSNQNSGNGQQGSDQNSGNGQQGSEEGSGNGQQNSGQNSGNGQQGSDQNSGGEQQDSNGSNSEEPSSGQNSSSQQTPPSSDQTSDTGSSGDTNSSDGDGSLPSSGTDNESGTGDSSEVSPNPGFPDDSSSGQTDTPNTDSSMGEPVSSDSESDS